MSVRDGRPRLVRTLETPVSARAPTPRPINPPAEPAKRDRPFLVPEEAPVSLFAFVFGGRDGILLLSA